MRETEVPGSSARGPFGVCFKLCDFFFLRQTRVQKNRIDKYGKTGYSHFRKRQLHDGTIFLCPRVYCKKKITQLYDLFVLAFTAKKVTHPYNEKTIGGFCPRFADGL